MASENRELRKESTRDLIAPILRDTYGDGGYVDAFAGHLAEKIDAQKWDSRGREYMVMLGCWDWFSGGTTAASTASKIEAALEAPDA